MNRETFKIKTPVSQNEVELKSWLTGGERRELRNAFLGKMELSVGNEKVLAEKINSAEVINAAEDKAIEMVIVSIDGKKENLLKTILGMRDKDYFFVINEINKITQEEVLSKKK